MPFAASKPILDVLLRTHATGNFRFGTERVTDALGGKPELTVRAVRSIVRSLMVLEAATLVQIRLTVIDDHSDAQSLIRMQNELNTCAFEVELLALEDTGNAASLGRAFMRARERDNTLVYFVEDDYLHELYAMREIVEAYILFSKNIGSERVGIFPVDVAERYTGGIEAARIVLGPERHWRTVRHTTGTFLTSRLTLNEQWEQFLLLCEDGQNEQISINPVWQNHASIFSPIPTLAYHMHLAEYMPPFSNWKKLWDTLAIGE